MSIPTISIEVNINKIDPVFQKEIGKALRRALKRVIRKMVVFLTKIVPQDTGRLLNSSINVLKGSFATNTFISVQYGFPVEYARYVNEMTNVNWTTPGTHGKFFQAGLVYLRGILQQEINQELLKIRVDLEQQERFAELLRLLLAFQSNKQLEESLGV